MKQKPPFSFRKITGKLHLILGLGSGLVVFIVALTGCLYAFQQEIQDLTQPYRRVASIGENYLPPSQIVAAAQKALPGETVKRVYFFEKEESVHVLFYGEDEESYYDLAFVDPYTAEVLHITNLRTDFFVIVLYLHISLLLGGTGKLIIGISTLIFAFMMLSGIILWWPKNKAARRQRFTIKWNASWKRTNYDLHNVLGFYICWISIFTVVTGLVWSFEWFEAGLYTVFSGGKNIPSMEDPKSAPNQLVSLDSKDAFDRLYVQARQQYPDAKQLYLYTPDGEEGVYQVLTTPQRYKYYDLDYQYFDKNTLEELPVAHYRGKYKDASLADKVLRMTYDIHTGGIFSLTGKFIAFFVSFIVMTLPISGFMIWRGRNKKKKQKEKEKAEGKQKSRAKPVLTN